MTDAGQHYKRLHTTGYFAGGGRVHHERDEYVTASNPEIHTNTVEGYYSIFKRGMKGVYQHCGEKHLHRYLAEFDFRYSNRVALGVDDGAALLAPLKGVVGKRLTYRALSTFGTPAPLATTYSSGISLASSLSRISIQSNAFCRWFREISHVQFLVRLGQQRDRSDILCCPANKPDALCALTSDGPSDRTESCHRLSRCH